MPFYSPRRVRTTYQEQRGSPAKAGCSLLFLCDMLKLCSPLLMCAIPMLSAIAAATAATVLAASPFLYLSNLEGAHARGRAVPPVLTTNNPLLSESRRITTARPPLRT